ncbi:MAG TPA: indole-3-glycerol phosphate synthase TrpC [Terriglobia bacterium]|nr:indole-3-glycerol phosphate synthase TrpC [Terriglobia bacterium]
MMQKVQGTILDEIISARLRRLEEIEARVPVSQLMRQVASRRDFRSFRSALSTPGVRVIAEMKKASPSAGLLRSDYECREIAKAYQSAGAVALSVLTEEDYFQGALNHLAEARSATALPVLRKDFILSEYQVYEAAAAGADAVLLIVAVLSENELRGLIALAEQLRIAPLVEVHTAQEVERALAAGAHNLGVNNRNLLTMEVDLSASLRLREKIPAHCRTVSESGIRSAADVKTLIDAGFDAMLVGESLMRTPDPGAALRAMIEGAREILDTAE